MKKTILFFMLLTSIAMDAQTNPPIYLQKNWYVKRMDNVFTYIAEGKLQKAMKEREEIKEKFAKDKDIDKNYIFSAESYLFPFWHVSNSLIMNSKEGREKQKEPISIGYDPWNAYLTLKQATGDPKNRTATDEFFKQRKLSYSVASIKADIEANLIAFTEKEGTEQAYDKLIDVLYDYADIKTVKTKRESIAFGESMKSESVSRLQQYLVKYSSYNYTHQRQITHRRDSLAFVQMEKSASGCKKYLSSYPQSEYYEEVEKQLHKYEFNDMKLSVAGCKDYLNKYPNSEYAGQVRIMLVRYAFDEAKRKGTPEAIAGFLREYGSSDKREEAIKELEELLKKKYFVYGTSLSELENFVAYREFGVYIDYSPFQAFYSNLTHLPTSAAMMDCKGLTGKVSITTSASENEYEETLYFNTQGLLTSQSNSRNGQNDSWEYESNEKGEVYPINKTDNRGKTTTYKTTFNTAGLVSVITGSDGTQVAYAYNSDNTLKTVTYIKGNQKTRIDYFDYDDRIIRSDRSGVTLVFEYNDKGDVVNMAKKRGNILMDQTSYEYEYGFSSNHWKTMRQYNNGSYFLTKNRSFSLP